MWCGGRLVFFLLVFIHFAASTLLGDPQEKLLSLPLHFIPAGPLELQSTEFVEDHDWQRLPYRRSDSELELPVLRVESFGDTALQFRALTPHRHAEKMVLVVEGPFPNAEVLEKAKVGIGPIVFERECHRTKRLCELRLGERGLYRLYAIPEPVWNETKVSETEMAEGTHLLGRLLTVCKKNCHRPTMNWIEFHRYLLEKNAESFWERIPEVMAEKWKLPPGEAARILPVLKAQIEKIREQASQKRERFPVLGPPRSLGVAQEILKGAEFGKPAIAQEIQGRLEAILLAGSADRDRVPTPLHPQLPEISYGHYVDDNLTDQELRHSRAVAQILSALSEPRSKDESVLEVEVNGKIRGIHSAVQFFEYLLETGHSVEVRDDRTYANFLALRIGKGTDAFFPPWLDTGLEWEGMPLEVPMGHSQHTWRIWGPKITARVAFFLGTGGTDFFPVVDSRPYWTGMRAFREFSSIERVEHDYLFKSVEFATLYIERNRQERQKLPADGYGLLGVCNDASALISVAASFGEFPVSAYPLLRAPEALLPKVITDALTPFFKMLPQDVDLDLSDGVNSPLGKSVLSRILAMNPHPLEAHWYPDGKLKKQINEISVYLSPAKKNKK